MQQQRLGRTLPLLCGLAAIALSATAITSLAPAAQLDQQTCDQLKAEVAQLEGMGVRANMAKGAAWGKANLRAADLEKIKKLIEMDEYVAFRCPRPKQAEPPGGAAAAAKPKVKVPTKAVAQGQPPAGTDPATKPKPKPKPATAEATQPAPQTAAAQPKPKPKPPAPPKAQDAYTPPKAPAPQ